jgi:hypothetical protein
LDPLVVANQYVLEYIGHLLIASFCVCLV